MKTKLFFATGALAAMMWAVPLAGAAHFSARPELANSVDAASIRFRVDEDRGLLVRVWLNGSGPFVFVLDTGAGMNVISQRLVTENRLPTKTVATTFVGGLSSGRAASNREAIINRLALGLPGNAMSKGQTALVVSNLPSDIDGIIDPTEVYAPGGYSIDLPKQTLEPLGEIVLDSGVTSGNEGAVVAWIRKNSDTRPFVRLGDGRLALVDTGSRFGLAVSDRDAIIVGGNRENESLGSRSDIAGGVIRSRRVAPTTISIGSLVLRRIPTDIVFGVHKDAPLILGRDALQPFKISFDPQRKLIAFVTSTEAG